MQSKKTYKKKEKGSSMFGISFKGLPSGKPAQDSFMQSIEFDSAGTSKDLVTR